MKSGNWVPLDKSLTAALPRKRLYTLVEAVFSYQVDIDNGVIKSFREYSRIWRWSLKKTVNFIRNKQGTKTEQARNTQETVKFRFIKPLQESKKQAGDKQETKREQAGNTTIYPNTILNNSFSEACRLSEFLASLILKNNPTHQVLGTGKYKATVQRWAGDIDKMIRLDGRPTGEIEEVITWCQTDPFWCGNILSGAKLRKQYDQLLIKMGAASVKESETNTEVEMSYEENQRLQKEAIERYSQHAQC